MSHAMKPDDDSTRGSARRSIELTGKTTKLTSDAPMTARYAHTALVSSRSLRTMNTGRNAVGNTDRYGNTVHGTNGRGAASGGRTQDARPWGRGPPAQLDAPAKDGTAGP